MASLTDDRTSAIICVNVHIRPKDSIDPRLIAAFGVEAFEKVGVQTQRILNCNG
jgi:hypothetical protein